MTEDDVTFDICFEECIRRIDYYKEKDLIQEYNQNRRPEAQAGRRKNAPATCFRGLESS